MRVSCVGYTAFVVACLCLATIASSCQVQDNTTATALIASMTTLCGQPTIEFQSLLSTTRNFSRVSLLATAATSFTDGSLRLDYHQSASLVPLRGRVLNHIGDQLVLAGCQEPLQLVDIVIGNRAVCCKPVHVLDDISVARIGLLVQLVLDRLAAAVAVDFIGTAPISLTTSNHVCPIPYNYQLWDFGDAVTNFGVVITALPHASAASSINQSKWVWERVPMWALPCAWDTRHRPVVTMLNVNPEWLQRELDDTIVMQEVQHHLMHALGFDATHDHVDPGLAAGALNSDIPSTFSNITSSWESDLSKHVVYWSASTLTSSSTSCAVGIPMDDEYELTAVGAYPNLLTQSPSPFATTNPWGSHYEPRVMGLLDAMSSSEDGRHSWNISVVTKELFQSLLPITGVTLVDQPTVPADLPKNYTKNALFVQYLSAAALTYGVTPQAYATFMQPPTFAYTTLPTPLSCAFIQTRCIPEQHTAEARSRFCVPAATLDGSGGTILQTCTPDFKGFMDCSSVAALVSTVAPSMAASIPAVYRYRLGSRNVTSFDAASDFCPMQSSELIESTFVSCATVNVDIPTRGNVYTASSRCVESNVTIVGPRPADVASLRCVNMRCSYGLRVELQMNGTTTWIPCPRTGLSGLVNITSYFTNFTGMIRCEAASVICGASATTSLVPWSPLPTVGNPFTEVAGFGIEYLLSTPETVFARSQSKTLCQWMPNSSTLAFIPSLDFAIELAVELPTTTTTLWIGATAPNKWDSMNGRYTSSSVAVPVGTTGCYVLNLTATRLGLSSVVASVDCLSTHQVLCTRAWTNMDHSLAFPSCPRRTRCSPTTLIADPRLHRSYFLSVNLSDYQQALLTRADAAQLCGVMFPNAVLFDLDNLVSLGSPTSIPVAQTPWYQALYSVINALQPNLLSVWTGLSWTAGTAIPPWSSLVSNWPLGAASGTTYCFLLVPPGIHFEPLYAVSDCSSTFPAVCYTQNPYQPTSIPGYDFVFHFNHVPVAFNRVSQGSYCAQTNSDGFFSPILDNGPLYLSIANWMLTFASGAAGTSWIFDDGTTSASSSLLLGATLTVVSPSSSSLTFPFANATGNIRLSQSATRYFVPSSTSSVTFASSNSGTFAVALTNATVTPAIGGSIFAASTTSQGAYICAIPKAQTPTSEWVSPVCSGVNATNWCDPINSLTADIATDCRFQLSRDLYSASGAATYCASLGAQLIFVPVFDNKNFSFYNVTQVAASMLYSSLLQGQLFWTGLTVVAGGITANGTETYTHLAAARATGLFAPKGGLNSSFSLSAADFPDGTCLAAYFPESPSALSVDRILLKAVDCTQKLYAPCKKRLIDSPPLFVPWSGPSATPPSSNILPIFSFAVISTAATYNEARRICRGHLGDLAWIPRTSTAPETIAALGNIITHPNFNAATTPLWMGFSAGPGTPLSSQTVQNRFRIPFSSNSVVENATVNCGSIYTSATVQPQSNCSLALPFACMRELPEFSIISPATVSAMIGGKPIDVAVKPGISATSFQSSLSGYQSLFSIMTNASASTLVQVSAPGSVGFAQDSGQLTIGVQFTSSIDVFVPVSLLMRGVLLQYCCGNSAFNVQSSWIVTVFPRPKLECSASISGPYDSATTTADVGLSDYTMYCRIAAVAPDATYTVVFALVPTSRGEQRSPSAVADLVTTSFSVQRNISSSREDWGGFASNMITLVIRPKTTTGGVIALNWSATCVTGTCSTTAATEIRTLRVRAPLPMLTSNLATNVQVWLSPAARFTVNINTAPFGFDKVLVNLTTSCPRDVLLLSPTFFTFRNSSSASGISIQMVALADVSSACQVTATYWLQQQATSNGDTAAVMNLQSASIVLGSVLPSSSNSLYFKTILAPPLLVVYPGDVFLYNVTRFVGINSVPSDISVAYSSSPANVLGSTSGTTQRITSTLHSFQIEVVVQNDTSSASYVDAMFVLTSSVPSLATPVRVVQRKTLTVLSTPTLVATGITTSDSVVRLSLPQAPVSTLNVTILCVNATYAQEFSSTLLVNPSSRISRIGSTKVLTLSVSLVPPDRLTDAEIPFDTQWTCAFLLSGAADVNTTVPGFSLTVRKRGRGSLASSATILRPGYVYLFVVTVQSSSLLARSVSVASSNITINGSVISISQASRDVKSSAIQADTTLTNCTVNISVPLSATYLTSTSITIQIQLNDTVWFRNPPSRTVELVPLISVSAVTSPTFALSQPVGSQASQLLMLQLSALPRQADVTIQCATSPATSSGATIARFTPTTTVVSMSSTTVTNASLTRVTVTMIGVVPNVIVSVECKLISAAGELLAGAAPNTSLSLPLLGGSSMQFVPLLQVSVSVLLFPGILFIGEGNERQVVVQISTLPMSDILVNLSMVVDSSGGAVPKVDPNLCISLLPNSWVLFGSSNRGIGTVVQNLTMRGSCDSSTSAAASEDSFFIDMSMFANVSLKASLSTTATNIDNSAEALKKLEVTFPILPKRVVTLVHAQTNQPLTTTTVYCGGSDTMTAILVNVSALPLDTEATATVRMPTTTNLVFTSPSALQFSKKLSPLLSREWVWMCALDYFTGSRANLTQDISSVTIEIDAPTEFAAPGPTVQLLLRKLLTATVTFPREITVGSLSISMTIAPELLPNDGQVLVIEFASSCPSAIALQHGNSVTWTPGMADSEQALRVLTYKPVQGCVVSLQLSQNSTARQYESTLYSQNVNLYDPSLVSWSDYDVGKNPRVSSDDLTSSAGVQLSAQVDQANAFVAATIIPYPLLDVTAFGNNTDFVAYVASLSNNTVTTAVYAMSNVPDSGSSGLLAILQTTPSVIQCVRHSARFPNILNVTIHAPFYTPSQDEMITLLFTQYALTRSDAPLSSSGTNISFYVVASPNKISDVREAFYATAYTVAAVASLSCGPALATRAIHMSAILDLVSCPNTNWKIQKSNAMNSVYRPIALQMGTDENLGPYMAAATYSVMLFAILVVFHVIAMFLVFARRLEMQTKTDSSTGVAMAMLRFPSLELFPALYVVGIVVNSTLKVMAYSDESSFRAAAIVLFAIVGVGIPSLVTYFSFFKVAPVVYQEVDHASGILSTLFLPRGRWILDSFVLTIANEELRMSLQRYLPKYGMLLEELVGSTLHSRNFTLKVSRLTSQKHHHVHRIEAMQAADALEDKQRRLQLQDSEVHISTLDVIRWRVSKHYYVFDVFLAVLVAATTVYEPINETGCIVEAWVLMALFLCQAIVMAVVQPFRRHCFNIMQTIMSLCQIAPLIAIEVSLLSDSRGQFVQDTTNAWLVGLAAVMVIYIVIDVMFSVAALIQSLSRKGYKVPPKVLAIVGDGDDLDHHQIELDENVPLRELLTGFVGEDAIAMSTDDAMSNKVATEWEEVHLYEESRRRGRSSSHASMNTVGTQDIVL